MRQPAVDSIFKSRGGMTTSFPIVPIEEIPAPAPSDAAGALRPMVLVVDGEPAIADTLTEIPVSYTHLDVYKRQTPNVPRIVRQEAPGRS